MFQRRGIINRATHREGGGPRGCVREIGDSFHGEMAGAKVVSWVTKGQVCLERDQHVQRALWKRKPSVAGAQVEGKLEGRIRVEARMGVP